MSVRGVVWTSSLPVRIFREISQLIHECAVVQKKDSNGYISGIIEIGGMLYEPWHAAKVVMCQLS